MVRRIRSSEIVVFCAFVLFGAAWLAVQQVRDPLPDWLGVVRLHPEIRTAFVAAQVAGLVALLAVAVGGLPILCTVLTQAIKPDNARVRRPLLVPVLAVVVLLGYVVLARGAWATHQRPGADAPLTPLAVVLQLGFFALVLLAIAGSTAAVAVAIARSEPDERMVRFALVPATIVTAAMGATLAAVLVLGLLIHRSAPQLFPPWQLAVTLVLMGVATGVAATALRRGIRARMMR
ncbi:MAG TPA: hypothetical protein VIC60_02650 [Thermomicrobiales bacterium]